MDGHCYQCATKFGFFKKEHSCHRCGHAYCKNCLPHSVVLPEKDPKKTHNVCSSCYKELQVSKEETQSDNVKNEAKYSPPENFKKRVAALQQKQQAPGAAVSGTKSVAKAASSSANVPHLAKYKGMSPRDREIAMRLEKLQEDRKKEQGNPASVGDMEERLRKLKDLPPKPETSQTVYKPPENKTWEQQYDDLMDEMSAEAALDARLEGREIPQSDQQVPSQHVPSTSQPGMGLAGQTFLLPTEEELKQLEEDAKKLMQAPHEGHTPAPTQPQGGQQPGTPAETGSQSQEEGAGDLDEQAKRLAEEANLLIAAAKSELNQEEAGAKRDAEYAERLAKLRERDPQKTEQTGASTSDGIDDEDEEKASQRLIKQLLEESKLDEEVASDGHSDVINKPQISSSSHKVASDPHPKPATDEDELPWCCICNNDAIVRCLDCDGDLYCKRCFREGHKEYGIETHRVKPYKSPSQ